MERLVGVLGIGVLIAIAWGLSERRKMFPWRIVIGGLVLQAVLAWLMLAFPPLVGVVQWIARTVVRVIGSADAGIQFLFGPLAGDPGGPVGFVFAFQVLPIIIFFAALMAVLYHIGVMQLIIAALAWLLRRSLGVTGAEALAMAANVFVGQTEAPLCIRPLLERLTRSQLMTLMTGGFATIAGSVLAGYVGFLGRGDEAQAAMWVKHLLTASVISAPAAFVIAKIMVPETETPPAEDPEVLRQRDDRASNLLDAAARGTSDGLRLALNVGAMLIAFVSLLALVNWPLRELGEIGRIPELLEWVGHDALDLQAIIGTLLMPLAWVMGVPWGETGLFGRLLAEKLVATEFIAFASLGEMLADPDGGLSLRSGQIAAYALCGFANFASIGIQIGGLTALVPERRRDIVSLALKAMIGGAMASWLTACIAGMFIAA